MDAGGDLCNRINVSVPKFLQRTETTPSGALLVRNIIQLPAPKAPSVPSQIIDMSVRPLSSSKRISRFRGPYLRRRSSPISVLARSVFIDLVNSHHWLLRKCRLFGRTRTLRIAERQHATHVIPEAALEEEAASGDL